MSTHPRHHRIATITAASALTLTIGASTAGVVHAAQQSISGPQSSCAFNQQRWDESKEDLSDAIDTAKHTLKGTGLMHQEEGDTLYGYLFEQPHASNYLALNNAYADAIAIKDTLIRPDCDGTSTTKIASEHALSGVVNATLPLERAITKLQNNSDVFEQQQRCDELRMANVDESDTMARLDKTVMQLRDSLTEIDQRNRDTRDLTSEAEGSQRLFDKENSAYEKKQREALAATDPTENADATVPLNLTELSPRPSQVSEQDRVSDILKESRTQREPGDSSNTTYLSRRLDSIQRSAQDIDLNVNCSSLDNLRLTHNDHRNNDGEVRSIQEQLDGVSTEITTLIERSHADHHEALIARDVINAQRAELQQRIDDEVAAQKAEAARIKTEKQEAEERIKKQRDLLKELERAQHEVQTPTAEESATTTVSDLLNDN